jgi:small subunit ribosomal protein S3
MGQKTHPRVFRLGVIETWDSKWFARHDYPKLLHEDFKVKKFLKSRLYHAGISSIEIARAANKAKINIYTLARESSLQKGRLNRKAEGRDYQTDQP